MSAAFTRALRAGAGAAAMLSDAELDLAITAAHVELLRLRRLRRDRRYSKATKGKRFPVSAAGRERMRQSKLGVPLSAAHREAIKQGQLARRAMERRAA